MLNRLRHALVLSTDDAFKYTIDSLKAMGYTVHHNESGYVFGVPSGSCIPVLMQAHIDTVRGKEDEPIILTEEYSVLYNANGVLGGDDRCGVQAVLEVARRYETKPFILFTNYEEPGNGSPQQGMEEFCKSDLLVPYLDLIYAFIGMDRKGHNQYVLYNALLPTNLEAIMLKCGYVQNPGTTTDGIMLQKKYDRIFINVSCGYYHPHSANEFVLPESYAYSIDRAANLIGLITEVIPYTSSKITSINTGTMVMHYPPIDGPSTPVHMPPSTTIISPAEICDLMTDCAVCGNNYRNPEYFPGLGQFLCHACVKRIKKFGAMNDANFNKAKKDLEEERKQSRLNNYLHNRKSRNNMPTCPVCKQSAYVRWDSHSIGFHCESCAVLGVNGDYNGLFWIIGNEKLYVKENTVLHVSMDNTKILKIENVKQSEHVKVCDVCKIPCLNHKAYLVEGAAKAPTYICRTCRDEVNDVFDLVADDGSAM